MWDAPEAVKSCRLFSQTRPQTWIVALQGRIGGKKMAEHHQRDLTQDTVLRAQIAMANRLIAEQSATIARAHSAIERAMETLRGPDGEGLTRTMWVADAR